MSSAVARTRTCIRRLGVTAFPLEGKGFPKRKKARIRGRAGGGHPWICGVASQRLHPCAPCSSGHPWICDDIPLALRSGFCVCVELGSSTTSASRCFTESDAHLEDGRGRGRAPLAALLGGCLHDELVHEQCFLRPFLFLHAPLDCIDAAETPVRRVSIRAHGVDVVSSTQHLYTW